VAELFMKQSDVISKRMVDVVVVFTLSVSFFSFERDEKQVTLDGLGM
jgi:hypothetical protein